MLWKKKRRVHMSGISVLFTFCGCILILGNVYVMYNGFLQFYDDPRNVLKETLGVEGVLPHTDLSSNMETLQDVPVIALPDSLRKVPSTVHIILNEPKLRRLMDNVIDRSKSYNEDEEKTFLRSKNTKQSEHAENKGTAGRKISSVSDSELRAALNKTSDCVKLQSLTNQEYIASGWTKAVYKTNMEGHPVALKKVDLSGHDMAKCGQQLKGTPSFCYKKASQKILKELLLLKALKLPNVVQVMRNIFL